MGKIDERIREVQVVAGMLFVESDRGCAIFGAQMIDDQLEKLFRKLFGASQEMQKIANRLFEGYGPLSTFSAKIELGYALGFIRRGDYADLIKIKKIRNKFAHASGPISFSHDEIKPLFRSLEGIGEEDGSSRQKINDIKTETGVNKVRKGDLINRLAFALVVQRQIGLIEYVIDVISNNFDGHPLWIALLRNRLLQLPKPKKIPTPHN